jgi:hypothetical protein
MRGLDPRIHRYFSIDDGLPVKSGNDDYYFFS